MPVSTFITDGCSIPKWKWLRKRYPRIDYWAFVFYFQCVEHDWDHHTRTIFRWRSTANFYKNMQGKAMKHAVTDGELDPDLLMEGFYYAKLFATGVHYWGWFDWYIRKPIKQAFHNAT